MELAWLESFLALCEHQSFTRAATSQHLSQPAFSRRIRSLERWAGVELIDRSAYPVALTPAGVNLRAEATHIVEALAGAKTRMLGERARRREAVRVATSHTLAAHFFPAWWQQVRGAVPDLHWVLLPMDTFDAYDALINGGCDLLLAHVDPQQPPLSGAGLLESITVATDDFGPYTQVTNGAPRYRFPTEPGEMVPFVSHGASVFLGRLTDRLLGDRRGRLLPVVQTDLTSAVARLVEAGAGLGWLPSTVTRDLVAQGRIAPLGGTGTEARLEIRVIRRTGHELDPVGRAIWGRIQASAKVER